MQNIDTTTVLNENFPGTCVNGQCTDMYSTIENVIGTHVGKDLAKSTPTMCLCHVDQFGALCEKDGNYLNQDDFNCNAPNGKFDINNTITGCSCRDKFGNPTKYHGWHCEISNFDLCNSTSNERIIHSKFSLDHPMGYSSQFFMNFKRNQFLTLGQMRLVTQIFARNVPK